MNAVIMELLKEAYFLLEAIDQSGADDQERRKEVRQWLEKMEKVTLGMVLR
jgi:hypothetical protein